MDSFKNITQFLNHNKNKDVVVVQGLGFVGAVMSIVCANSSTDYAVIGVDVKENEEIINNINKGKFHIKSSDPKVEKYFIESMRRKNFYATYDPVAYSFASTIIVDINLDVQKESDKDGNLISYDVNLNPFKQAIKTYQESRQDYYEQLSTFSSFGRGWTRRVQETTKMALEMI